MKEIKIGESFTKEITVTESLLACNVGSGNVSVYATPMMMALMEGASAELLTCFLDEGETSVGSSISSTHLAPTPVGMKVRATAVITEADGRKITFSVKAEDETGLIGEGKHERFILNKVKFEQKAQSKLG